MKLTADSVLYRRARWGVCVVLVLIAIIPVVTQLVGSAEATAKVQPDYVRSSRNLSITAQWVR